MSGNDICITLRNFGGETYAYKTLAWKFDAIFKIIDVLLKHIKSLTNGNDNKLIYEIHYYEEHYFMNNIDDDAKLRALNSVLRKVIDTLAEYSINWY